MATYSLIQNWVRAEYGYMPKTCWIAHVKELCGLTVRSAPNRLGPGRSNPCPPEKVPDIRAAFRHFGMMEIEEVWRDGGQEQAGSRCLRPTTSWAS
jgi:hypothetical protein